MYEISTHSVELGAHGAGLVGEHEVGLVRHGGVADAAVALLAPEEKRKKNMSVPKNKWGRSIFFLKKNSISLLFFHKGQSLRGLAAILLFLS